MDTELALVEPARNQVLGLAAEVLGRLPTEEIPSALRPFARFAPGKRRRLGAGALAAALDADDQFRARVAETLVEAAPELTAAVRGGQPPAAADPIDVAVVAYLTRPARWQDVLAAATRRWVAEHGPVAGRSEELDRLRAELAELRAQARGESARIKEAVAAAAADAQAEIAALRRRLRERTRELRAAEQERAAAEQAATQLRAELAAAASAHEAELRRHRARHADVTRSAESARREARLEREIDDARLWLLIDTLVQAASGLRRELSLPPSELRPADAVEAAAKVAARRTATDPGALDRLLALPNVHLVIDGYNVTKTGYDDLALADQRGRLIGALAPLAAQSGAEITVAFDGGAKPPVQPVTPRGVRVLFSAADETADDLIRRLVAAEPAGRPVVVVSSDREIATDVGRAGAWTVPSAVLLARLG